MILFCPSGISSRPSFQAPTPSDQAFVPEALVRMYLAQALTSAAPFLASAFRRRMGPNPLLVALFAQTKMYFWRS
jgi:hypothetical protein